MPIQVTIDGNSFRTDDFTMDEAIAAEELAGDTWLNMNPFRSAKWCRAIMVIALKRSMSQPEAERKVDGMTVDAALDCLSVVDDDLPTEYEGGIPLGDKAEPSTDGSFTSTE